MKIYQAAVGTDTDYEKYFEIGYIYIVFILGYLLYDDSFSERFMGEDSQ